MILRSSKFPICNFLRSRVTCTTRCVSSTVSDETLLSSVHRGIAFEHRAMLMLRDLSMSLSRVGGRNDGGIDLQGWWWLPDPTPNSKPVDLAIMERDMNVVTDNSSIRRRRIRVLAQCKAERKKLGPNYVREMEGVLQRHFHLNSSEEALAKAIPTVAILVSESSFTKATVLCALSSPLPFLLLHLPRVPRVLSTVASETCVGEEDPKNLDGFASAIWNPALGGQKGVLRGEIDLRWELSQDPATPRRPSLWWHGTRLESWVPLPER